MQTLSALICRPGYHAGSQTIYMPPEGFRLPPVSESPSPSELQRAIGLLLDDLMGDFPFVGDADRAHALAAALLAFCREMITGPTPPHLVSKPTPRTGATLYVQVVGEVVLGHAVAVLTEARSEEEWSRKLFAKLRSGPSLLLIDNVIGTLGSAALAAATTGEFFEDRIVGRSETQRVPVRCVWLVTGTNPALSPEIARRSVPIRLDARLERPERRTDFRHPDLRGWVREHRESLVWASLIIIQAWIAADRPKGAQTLGGFESWSGVIGGILDVAGVAGFLENREAHDESCDSESATFAAFIQQWWAKHGAQPVRAADVLELADELDLGDKSEQSRKIRLGKELHAHREQRFGGVRLEKVGVLNGSQQWRLMRVKNQ